jgi:hypothetical protein
MRRVLDTLDATQKQRDLSLLTERMNPHQRGLSRHGFGERQESHLFF